MERDSKSRLLPPMDTPDCETLLFRASNWTRTSDTRIMRPLLYLLSYGDLVEGKRIELLSFPCKRNVLTIELTPPKFFIAPLERLELPTAVLETDVLPLKLCPFIKL